MSFVKCGLPKSKQTLRILLLQISFTSLLHMQHNMINKDDSVHVGVEPDIVPTLSFVCTFTSLTRIPLRRVTRLYIRSPSVWPIGGTLIECQVHIRHYAAGFVSLVVINIATKGVHSELDLRINILSSELKKAITNIQKSQIRNSVITVHLSGLIKVCIPWQVSMSSPFDEYENGTKISYCAMPKEMYEYRYMFLVHWYL